MATSNGAVQKSGGTIQDLLERRRDEISKVLPRHMTPDRLMRVALTSIGKNPDLMACSGASLLSAILQCAELGLEPGGALGHAYLVPFKQKDGPPLCTLIIGYRGLLELMRRSGELSQVEAHIIYERDEYKVRYGLNPEFFHTPKLDGDAGKPVLVYMIARMKDGSQHVEIMKVPEVEAIRARSRYGKYGPWVTDWGEMAKKTVLRRGAKYLPLSSERLARAMDVDNDDFVDGESQHATEATAANVQVLAESKTAQLKRKLSAGKPIIDVAPGQSEDEAEKAALQPEPPSDNNAPWMQQEGQSLPE